MGCCSSVKNKIMLFAEKLMEPENHQVKQSKPGFERQIVHVFPHMWNMDFFLIQDITVEGMLFEG